MKYIFIDSNQYRHLFSSSEGFSDSVYDLLIKLTDSEHVSLLLPQQTKEEIERNQYREWPENEIKALDNKIQKLTELLPKIKEQIGIYKSWGKLEKEIDSEIKKSNKDRKKIISTFTSSQSKANQKLHKLIEKSEFIKETKMIMELAEVRNKKGNPPYDDKGIGDALIWESLIQYLSKTKGANLLLVSNDKTAWGKLAFDQMLQSEYKTKVGGKVMYSNKLSEITDLTAEEQKEIEKIKKEEFENLKRNAIVDFINSQSFTDAGEKATNLLQFKNILTTGDYQDILRGSLTNNQIYQSFFTGIPLTKLVSGSDGYISKKLESLDSDLWSRFAKLFNISLKRQSDQLKETINNVDDDFPF